MFWRRRVFADTVSRWVRLWGVISRNGLRRARNRTRSPRFAAIVSMRGCKRNGRRAVHSKRCSRRKRHNIRATDTVRRLRLLRPNKKLKSKSASRFCTSIPNFARAAACARWRVRFTTIISRAIRKSASRWRTLTTITLRRFRAFTVPNSIVCTRACSMRWCPTARAARFAWWMITAPRVCCASPRAPTAASLFPKIKMSSSNATCATATPRARSTARRARFVSAPLAKM